MITPDTVVTGVDPYDMPEEQFTAIQVAAGSPAADDAHDGYMVLGTMPVSIAFCLAIFHHESQYGKVGITPTYETKNPGNCRSTRTGMGTVISTPKGPFVKYLTWPEGWRDLAWRLIDPTYAYVKEGRNTIREIITRFAPASDNNVPESYIASVVKDMNAWADGGVPMAAQIPGFAWHKADADHYDVGRTQKIRGGAQHYTAGTNSRAWLSSTSQPPVSATFLVKHYPALDDRGWQLVRIEDTAWTTSFANPYTVSIEYEHMAHEAIPDAAYDVLAQTWIDIAAYVAAHRLGIIPLSRAGIRGHKEWVNNPQLTCPDGIDVDRIVRRIQELIAPTPPADDRILVAGNPYGEFGYKLGFKGRLQQIGAAVSPDSITLGILAWAGYAREDEWYGTDGCAYQRTERLILKYEPGVDPPFDIVAKLRTGDPLPERMP